MNTSSTQYKDVLPFLRLVLVHGLGCHEADLSVNQLTSQARVLFEAGLHKEDFQDFLFTLKYGMPEIWPISETGVFDARDVVKHYLKARAVALKLKRAGRLPING